MKLLKHNKSKGEWVNTYSAILDKIPETVIIKCKKCKIIDQNQCF